MNKTNLKSYFTSFLFLLSSRRFNLMDLVTLSAMLTAYYKYGPWPAFIAVCVGSLLSSALEDYCKTGEPK